MCLILGALGSLPTVVGHGEALPASPEASVPTRVSTSLHDSCNSLRERWRPHCSPLPPAEDDVEVVLPKSACHQAAPSRQQRGQGAYNAGLGDEAPTDGALKCVPYSICRIQLLRRRMTPVVRKATKLCFADLESGTARHVTREDSPYVTLETTLSLGAVVMMRAPHDLYGVIANAKCRSCMNSVAAGREELDGPRTWVKAMFKGGKSHICTPAPVRWALQLLGNNYSQRLPQVWGWLNMTYQALWHARRAVMAPVVGSMSCRIKRGIPIALKDGT